MRTVTLMLLAAMALMVGLFAVVAYAATIEGTRQGETLIEQEERERVESHASCRWAHEVLQRHWWRRVSGSRTSPNRASAKFVLTVFLEVQHGP